MNTPDATDDVLQDLIRAARDRPSNATGSLPPHQPSAAVLACSDARVPPQLIFGQDPGRLFTVRVAGNLATPVTIGSLTYAIDVLGVRLLIVLGHEGCGAVGAALEAARGGADPATVEGPLAPIMTTLAPAIAACRAGTTCTESQAVRANVEATVETLLRDQGPVGRLARSGELHVIGAVYDPAHDRVRFLHHGDTLEDGGTWEESAHTAMLDTSPRSRTAFADGSRSRDGGTACR
jgi:carbonic anhydrase